MSEPIEREPCPFCGTDRISITMGDRGQTYITCQICLAQGPIMPANTNDAWTAWNKCLSRYNEGFKDGYQDGWMTLREELASDLVNTDAHLTRATKRVDAILKEFES